jgi:hypothetical protein
LRLAVTITALCFSLVAGPTASGICTLTLRYENGSLVWDKVLGATDYWVLEAYGTPVIYRQHNIRGTSMPVTRRSSAATSVRYVVTAVVQEGIRSVEDEPPMSEGTDACAASISIPIPADPSFRALTRKAILPVVGSTPGAFGGKFKTSLVMRPLSITQRGRIVFHPTGRVATDADPSIPYAFSEMKPLIFEDVVAAMGQAGIGSLDIIPDEDAPSSMPIIEARIYNDTTIGTFGTVVMPAYPFDYLHPQPMEVVIPESDASRVSIGFRTLTDTKMRIFVESAEGVLLSFHDVSYPAGWMQMTSPRDFVGKALAKGQVVTVAFTGSVIPFYTVTDNSTNDSTLIVSPARIPSRNVGAYVD